MINTSNIIELSHAVTPLLLAGNTNFLRALRNQYDHLKSEVLDFNGYGFYIDYEIEEKYRILNKNLQKCVITDLVGLDDTGDAVVGFQIFISDGTISTLEGFPYASHVWPEVDIQLVYVRYDANGCNPEESLTRFPEVIESLPDSPNIATAGNEEIK